MYRRNIKYMTLIALTGILIMAFSGMRSLDHDTNDDFPILNGPYLGQALPGADPELFAPGIIPTGMYTRDVAMTPDGDEFYFCIAVANYNYTAVMVSRNIDGQWTEPEVTPFSRDFQYMILEPAISPDGSKFYFLSNRPDINEGETTAADQDIWVMDRTGDGWSEPYNLGPPVNSDGAEFFPSLTNDGTMYFTRVVPGERANKIYRSRMVNGEYMEAELLPPQVNCAASQFNAFIARDESYIIVCTGGRADTKGGSDYYVVFRNEKDEWSEPVNMGDKVNTEAGSEWSPYVSPDEKYFFFMSDRKQRNYKREMTGCTITEMLKLYNEPQNGYPDIYWMDASFIQELRPDGF
ncbi:hypothetical protein ACFL6G_02345 [candidate division KSB1 bacterium]